MTDRGRDEADMSGQLVSVNIGTVREVQHNGRTVRTGIFKTPTTEPQVIAGVHVGADLQADTNVHGGHDKAIYAYAAEDYSWWEQQLDRELPPGLLGENLTTRGIDVSGANVGDRWHIGSTMLEVSEPRIPCYKLGIAVNVSRFQQTFAAADRPGTYLRILKPGQLAVGDAIEVEALTEPTVSVREISAIYHRRHHDAQQLIDTPRLSDSWRNWARDLTPSES